MKSLDQIEIESVLNLYFSSCLEIEWDPYSDEIQISEPYDNDSHELKNNFRVRILKFKFEELQLVAKHLQNWSLTIFSYLDQVGIEFEKRN